MYIDSSPVITMVTSAAKRYQSKGTKPHWNRGAARINNNNNKTRRAFKRYAKMTTRKRFSLTRDYRTKSAPLIFLFTRDFPPRSFAFFLPQKSSLNKILPVFLLRRPSRRVPFYFIFCEAR